MTAITDIVPALLVLEDGTVFRGRANRAVGETFGEAVFTTGMSGYQETITDPSYHRQVVVQTAPHIGNYGVNDDDAESRRIWVAGFVVRDPSRISSNWRALRRLDDDLVDQGIVGISDVDTRAITRHLRERGAMRVGVFSGDAAMRPVAELLGNVVAFAVQDLCVGFAVEFEALDFQGLLHVGHRSFGVGDHGIGDFPLADPADGFVE